MTAATDPDLWERDIACPGCGHGIEQYHGGDWIDPLFHGCQRIGCDCTETPVTIIRDLQDQLAQLG